jgi:hypothetical protein
MAAGKKAVKRHRAHQPKSLFNSLNIISLSSPKKVSCPLQQWHQAKRSTALPLQIGGKAAGNKAGQSIVHAIS